MRELIMIDLNDLEYPLFDENRQFSKQEAWLWIIFGASYQEEVVRTKKGHLPLKRGQLTASTRFLAQKWGWKESRVRRFLKRLKSEAMIDLITDDLQTVLTICNYDKFQDFISPETLDPLQCVSH